MTARFPLETACRLSRSVLWRLQRRFGYYGEPAAARARLDEALALDPAHAGALALAARLAGRDAPALG